MQKGTDGLRNALRSVNLTSVVGEGDRESCWQTWKDLFLAAVNRRYQSYQEKGTVRRNPSVSLKVKF